MTKKDLAKNIAEETGVTNSKVQEIVQRVLDGIIEVLVTEGRIERVASRPANIHAAIL